jgi:hypothetical protein
MIHFKGDKIRSTTSFGREVKPSLPCRNISWHVKYPYGKKEILVGKIKLISRQVSPTSQQGVSAGYCQRGLEGESGMTVNQMGKHNTSVMVALCGMPCAIPRREQQQ